MSASIAFRLTLLSLCFAFSEEASWGAQPGEEQSEESTPPSAEERRSRFAQRLKATGSGFGEGLSQILIGPGRQRIDRSMPDPDAAIMAEAATKDDRSYFIPHTLVRQGIDAHLDVNFEVNQLLKTTGTPSSTSDRSPSSALVAVLKRNQVLEANVRQERMQDQPKPRYEWDLDSLIGEASGGREVPSLDALTIRTSERPNQKGRKERFQLFALVRRTNDEGADEERETVIFNPTTDYEFASLKGISVPFHVFDVDPRQETILVELSGDEVARVKRQGAEWSWIQLESGLMGLVRNHHVQEATEAERLQYEGGGEPQSAPEEIAQALDFVESDFESMVEAALAGPEPSLAGQDEPVLSGEELELVPMADKEI
ncbi:MAG: hypothetical protein AAGJ31_10065 [Verrucomicrobiota bacterium]